MNKGKGGQKLPDYRNYNYEDKSNAHNNQFSRATRNGKKKRSWVSLIIHIIVLVLVGITGYSMYKQPLFIFGLKDTEVGYTQLKNFKQSLSNLSELSINSDQVTKLNGLGLSDIAKQLEALSIKPEHIEQLKSVIEQINMLFNIFFGLCILSLILTILTLLFNRTLLKLLNFLSIASMLAIVVYFMIAIDYLAQRIAKLLNNAYVQITPDQVIIEADATHNAIILLICCLALIFLSLFFRSKRQIKRL